MEGEKGVVEAAKDHKIDALYNADYGYNNKFKLSVFSAVNNF